MAVMSRTKHEVVSEFRSAEILEAARKVFARKGFEQTTVEDIASTAGVAKGTLYLYFRSKRDIYLAALRQGILALHAESDRSMAKVSSAPGKLRAFIGTRVKYLEENRDFFRIYYSEFANFFVPLSPGAKGMRDAYLQQAQKLEAVLEQAVRRAEVRKICPQSTALRIYDLTLGVIAQRLLGWSKATVEEDVDAVFELLWRGIKL